MKTDKQTRILLEKSDKLVVDLGSSDQTELVVVFDSGNAVRNGKVYKLVIRRSWNAESDENKSLNCLLVETNDAVQFYHAPGKEGYHRVFNKPSDDSYVQLRVGKLSN